MGLLIVGGTVIDIIFPRVPRLPAWPDHLEFTAANLVLLGEPPLVTIGGNGANAAFVAANCGAAVTLHSNIGADAFGALARGWLSVVERVVPNALARPRSAQTKAVGASAPGGRAPPRTAINVTAADHRHRRATFFYPGGAPLMPKSAAGSTYALVCGWPHPAPRQLAQGLRAWRKQSVQTALDIGPLLGTEPTWSELGPVLAELDLFLSNEHEALVVTATRTLSAALSKLRTQCAGHLVIKLGKQGVLWLSPEAKSPTRFAAPRVKAANTIGAGDSFNGALLAALDRGVGFAAALRSANQVASKVVSSGRGVLGLSDR